MNDEERGAIEKWLDERGMTPITASYQNATTAREPAERFNQWMYLYEVTLKTLASVAWSRSRALGNQPPEILFFVRDSFRETSQGHWLQLLTSSRDHLRGEGDQWGRRLDGALRKKLRDESLLKIGETVATLKGHPPRTDAKVSLIEVMQTLIELRNKTQGHGAPRRHFYEDTIPHLEASLLRLLAEFEPLICGDLLYVERIDSSAEGVIVDGLLLRALKKRRRQVKVAVADWLQNNIVLALEEAEGYCRVFPLDPLLIWDERNDAVCIYNAYVENRQQFEYLSYARGEPVHRTGRSFEAAFGLPVSAPTLSRGSMKLWSDKGVALYPVDTPLVGQNSVFNALVKFRRKFDQSRLASFFALIGDWGLGKSRIGFELFAESFSHVDRWLVNTDEYVVPSSDERILAPGLAEGILPLFIRYDMVCDDDLFVDNWIARVATDALALVLESSGRGKVPAALPADLRSALQARNVDMKALQTALAQIEDYDARLQGALEVLQRAGIEHLWVVVDELETVTDYQRGLPEPGGEPVAAEFLTLVADVFRHEHYRAAQPFYANVHFLLLCSEGMRDKLEIGPSRRRDDVLTLTPNRLSDVRRYIQHIREQAATAGQTVDYPQGTAEAAFLASNRNFGWFNVIMSSIHEAYQRHRAEGNEVTAAQLLEEFARTEARASRVFDTSGLDLLQGVASVHHDLVNRLVFGQLPVTIGVDITEAQAEELQRARLPGLESPPFAELIQVHIDAGSLAAELTRPEVGFRLASHETGDVYEFYNARLSITALLAALQAFSVATENDDILICAERSQFSAQLKALYPEQNIEQAADALHQVFTSENYRVSGPRYLAVSFPLLQRVDKLLTRETQRTTFFRNPEDEPRIERYVREVGASDTRRQQAICEGFAKLLDEGPMDLRPAREIQAAASVSFRSSFQSPRLDSLRVTRDGRLTITYCRDVRRLVDDLTVLLSQQPVHPVVVLLSPHADAAAFEQATSLLPLLKRSVIARRLNIFEEDFLIRYSGRDVVFQSELLSDWSYSRMMAIRDEWKRQTDDWHARLEASGYLLRPIWYSMRGLALDDFYRAYRLMLTNGWTIDGISPEMNQGFDSQSFAQVVNACRKNVEVPPSKLATLAILSEEPYRPIPHPAFGALLYELRPQASLENLAGRFFFADSEMQVTKQLEQTLELLRALGLVTVQTEMYRTINSDLLPQYREATSAWLNGPCRDAIKEIKEFFAPEAEALEVGELRFASDDLEKAEKLINETDLTPLARSPQVDPDTLSTLVRQIQEIELTLQKICPPEIYRRESLSFQCTPDQIRGYSARYKTLSLWEKVNFLRWLRGAFAERRSEIIDEIRRQLKEAETMQVVSSYPFPIAALTMPLKAIEQELALVTAGDTVSVSGRLEIPGYPYEVRRYLITGRYEEAWYRLDALGRLVDRHQPASLWARFKAAHARWETAVRHFEQAQPAWKRLSAFMADAPPGVWGDAERIRADYSEAEAVLTGGLRQTIASQAANVPGMALLDELDTEVDGYSRKIEGLQQRIAAALGDIERSLKSMINLDRLRALNEVLRALRQSEVKLPDLAESYSQSKHRFESFNAKVNDRGLALFDQTNRVTTWMLWLEMYQDLVNDQYIPKPDHRAALDELEEMGIVVRTVKLRR
ncbi:MAG TPA: hypothetical protein DEP84_28110 [Chloroflexi bacterium]|nr:hypothetical protein [Chloroflexota bacterium]